MQKLNAAAMIFINKEFWFTSNVRKVIKCVKSLSFPDPQSPLLAHVTQKEAFSRVTLSLSWDVREGA